jgi:hypothetical protein
MARRAFGVAPQLCGAPGRSGERSERFVRTDMSVEGANAGPPAGIIVLDANGEIDNGERHVGRLS